MRKGILDDDYYFYPDGRILHSYDKTQNKLNVEDWIDSATIPDEKKAIMKKACPEEYKERVESMLG